MICYGPEASLTQSPICYLHCDDLVFPIVERGWAGASAAHESQCEGIEAMVEDGVSKLRRAHEGNLFVSLTDVATGQSATPL